MHFVQFVVLPLSAMPFSCTARINRPISRSSTTGFVHDNGGQKPYLHENLQRRWRSTLNSSKAMNSSFDATAEGVPLVPVTRHWQVVSGQKP